MDKIAQHVINLPELLNDDKFAIVVRDVDKELNEDLESLHNNR